MSPLEFKALQADWDRRLKLSGFSDIENRAGRLKNYQKIPRPKEEQARYYRRCTWFLWDYSFPNLRYRKIWELHCEGWGRERIRTVVKSMSEDQIRYVLQKLHEAMLTYHPDLDEDEDVRDSD